MDKLGTSGRAAEYLDIMRGLWPLCFLAAGLAFTVGFKAVKRSYLQRTPLQVLGNLLFSSIMAGAAVIGSVCVVDKVMPNCTSEIHVGIAVFVGLFGMKGFDFLLRKYLGLDVADLMDPQGLNELRVKMDPETRRQHLAQCPFKHDGDGECAGECPHGGCPNCKRRQLKEEA